MIRPYLLVSKIDGVADRIVQASTRSGALAIASESTWDVTPADAITIRAFERVGVKVEETAVADPAQIELGVA